MASTRTIRAAREVFSLLPAFVRQTKRAYGSWDIVSSHAIHTAGTLMAVMGDRTAITEMRTTLATISDLREWLSVVDAVERDADCVDAILAVVKDQPGVSQLDLKRRTAIEDGRRLSTLATWLEKGGRIQRVRKGETYRLYPKGFDVSVANARRSTGAEATGAGLVRGIAAPPITLRVRPARPALKARDIDLEKLPYVRLPKAPAKWEARERRSGGQGSQGVEPNPTERSALFRVEGEGWRVVSEEKLPPDDRPNPAFRDVFPTSGSTFWLDPKGRREGFEHAAAILQVTGRDGERLVEQGLHHDVYRADVNARGSGILFLSRDGVLHAYTDRLDLVLAEQLADLPEYQAQADRFGIARKELKNHTRCVALSTDRSRYLVTVVDEVWCLSTVTGEVLWGLRLPTNEGWTRVAGNRSDRVGTDSEVGAALRLMELDPPVTPEVLTRQYRRLAMRRHPDRNPEDSGATRRFQELAAAVELLTGVDLSDVGSAEVETVSFEKLLGRRRVDVPVAGAPSGSISIEISFSMGTSERYASDWIYAASFGSVDGRVFVAGYSGRILEISADGVPARVYDIGAVPRHIADNGGHLYVLTDTRLYVLTGDGLEAVVDVFEKGNLLPGDTGFGLLQTKEFDWFSPTGKCLGVVRTRDPLRRVFSSSDVLVVETRQHRARIGGLPSWWMN